MAFEPEPHAFRTNFSILGYFAFSALALVGFLGFVFAAIYAGIRALSGDIWFATRLIDFLGQPSSGQPALDAAIAWVWQSWIGWPFLAITIISTALTALLVLSLGNEPDSR